FVATPRCPRWRVFPPSTPCASDYKKSAKRSRKRSPQRSTKKMKMTIELQKSRNVLSSPQGVQKCPQKYQPKKKYSKTTILFLTGSSPSLKSEWSAFGQKRRHLKNLKRNSKN